MKFTKNVRTILLLLLASVIIIIVALASGDGFHIVSISNPRGRVDIAATPTPTVQVTPNPTYIIYQTQTKVPIVVMTLASFQVRYTENYEVYKIPQKIIGIEDIRVGDLIQRSESDPLYDKYHGFVIESAKEGQVEIREIVKLERDSKWVTMASQNSRSVSEGALMWDYPNRVGHASAPLGKKCYVCKPYSELCPMDDMIWVDC